MPLTIDEFRELLQVRGAVTPLPNRLRVEQIERRVRRARRRRAVGLVAGGGSVVAAVAALLVGIGGIGPVQEASVASGLPQALPKRFTAPDGAIYDRLGAAELTTPRQESTSLTVPVSGKPLDVAVSCRGSRETPGSVDLFVDGARAFGWFHFCTSERRLQPIQVLAGAKKITLSFRRNSPLAGSVMPAPGSGSGSPEAAKTWSFGIYEWSAAASPTNPPQPAAFPDTMRVGKPVRVEKGIWPQQDTVTIRVPDRGKPLSVHAHCSGPLADRLTFTVVPDGTENGGCFDRHVDAFNGIPVPRSENGTATIRVRLVPATGTPAHPAYAGRRVSWSIAVVERQ